MLSYALDVWRVSWITAASKAQSGLLAVPEDTSLQKKKKERREKIFIKFASHRQAVCFSYFCQCVCICAWRPLDTPASYFPQTHTFHRWPVSKVITGRLLHAFMKYSNGSMSYCALIMPHKDRKGRRGADTDRQTENNNERTPYLLRCGQNTYMYLSPHWTTKLFHSDFIPILIKLSLHCFSDLCLSLILTISHL